MKCEICKKILINTQERFCSRECLYKSNSLYNKINKIIPPTQSGRKWTSEQKDNLKIIRKKRPNSMKRPEVVLKAQATKKKTYDLRGRRTPEFGRIRKSLEYRFWRESVFKRDKYTCIWCNQIGGRLNADHIKPFAYYPELRFAIDNGRTLCENCHRKTDTFGKLALKHKRN
jgi:5-methylcytosine-specific restriction endonuclease McrA